MKESRLNLESTGEMELGGENLDSDDGSNANKTDQMTQAFKDHFGEARVEFSSSRIKAKTMWKLESPDGSGGQLVLSDNGCGIRKLGWWARVTLSSSNNKLLTIFSAHYVADVNLNQAG